MSCTIQYIEDIPLASAEEKARLTKLHIDTARRLNTHRVDTPTSRIKVFQYRGDKLVVPVNSDFYAEAENIIKIINTDLGAPDNNPIVSLVADPTSVYRQLVKIDVRPDQSHPIDVDTEEQMVTFYRNVLGDSEIVTGSLEFEDKAMDVQHAQTWKQLTESITEKSKRYLGGLQKSNDSYRSTKTEEDLKLLISLLKDESTAGVLESVSKYIVMSGFNLGNIKDRLRVIEAKLAGLSTNPTARKQQLKETADFVRHSTYFYHLFDLLDDMKNEFSLMGMSPRAIDNYERDLLERDMRKFFESVGVFDESEVVDLLNIVPSEIAKPSSLFRIFKQMYKDKLPDDANFPMSHFEALEDDFNDVVKSSLRPGGVGLQRQLINTLDQLGSLKVRLKELHYETLTEIYYPSFQKSFLGKEGKQTIDGKGTIGDKYLISKDKFKTMLRIAEEDPSAIEKWGSAMINSSDVISTTIANYFKEVMIDIDLTNKEDINGLQEFLTKNKREQGDAVLKETDEQSVHLNDTIEAVQIVDDTYVPERGDSVIELTVLGVTAKYRARKTKNYLSKFNHIRYGNLKKAFQYHVESVAENFADQLLVDRYALEQMDISDPTLSRFYDLLYPLGAGGTRLITNHLGRFLSENPTRDELKGKIQSMLHSAFYSNNLSNLTEPQVNDKFTEHGILVNGELVDLNDDDNFAARRHVTSNSNWNNYKTYVRGPYESSNLNDRFHFSPDSLFGLGDKELKQVLVRYADLSYGYAELVKDTATNQVFLLDTSGKDIYQFATFSKEYITLNDSYDIEKGGFGPESQRKWNAIQNDPFKREYFARVNRLYDGANKNYVQIGLRNREVPQVRKMDESSRLTKVKETLNKVGRGEGPEMFSEYAKTYLVEEDKVALMKDGVYVDEDGVEVNDPIYVSTERQYINGQKIRDVSAKFNRPVPLEDLETDLYKSVLMYKTASNSFRGLKNNESQALLLQSVLEGDSSLGLPARKAKVKQYGKDVTIPGGGIKYKEHELRSSAMIVSFINDYVFGVSNEDSGIFGTQISAKKVASVISGYTAYTALAWNAFTIPSNRLISLHNTRAVATGNEFFNTKHWGEALIEYKKATPGFLNDFRFKGFTNQKSAITQMAIRFNAVQGEFLSPQGLIHTKGLAEKMSDSAVYWTQEIAEHANQLESMIMLMKGYNLPSGVSLWDAIQTANVDRAEGESLRMPVEFTRDLEIEFQKRLQGVNRQIHGNYGKLDRTMMQKGVMTNLVMTFKKYIYDGFRSRFQEERFDQEIRDEQEGYFRTYLKAMNEEFSEIAKTQGLTAALKSSGAKSLGRSLLKTTLGGWDSAFGRLASGRNSDTQSELSKWLYGDKNTITDRQYYAAMRATYDVGNMVRAMLAVIAVEAIMSGLDDDDEELRFILSYVEIYSQKLESDIGLFTSFTNFATGPFVGGATLDQMYRLWKAPMAASRSIDTTTSIFKQLISFDVMNEEGDYEFKWHALDQYNRDGEGYDKGDYKIVRKFNKSLFAPISQMYKMMSPEQQLDYLKMVNKYSQ